MLEIPWRRKVRACNVQVANLHLPCQRGPVCANTTLKLLELSGRSQRHSIFLLIVQMTPWKVRALNLMVLNMERFYNKRNFTSLQRNLAFSSQTFLLFIKDWNIPKGTSLVAQWLRIRLPIPGTRVRALVWEDPTCRRATKPVHHNYWAHVLQLLKPAHLEPVLCNKRSHRNEKPAHCNKE